MLKTKIHHMILLVSHTFSKSKPMDNILAARERYIKNLLKEKSLKMKILNIMQTSVWLS